MNLLKSLCLYTVACLSIFSSKSYAADVGVTAFAEPYTGWSLFGKYTNNTSGADIDAGNFNGFEFGSRLGVGYEMFFCGLDFSYIPSNNVSYVPLPTAS